MEWLQAYELLHQREREEFARVVTRLLSATFIVRNQEDGRRDYYFAERHEQMIAGYLRLILWDLVVDRTHGVAQVINRSGGTRLQLRLMDSVLLLLLRLIYEERRRQLNIVDDIVCEVREIHEKAYSLRVREKAVIEKKHLTGAFSIFRRHSLIEVLGDDLHDPHCRIRLYPSLLFAVKLDGLLELQERLAAYGEGGDTGEADDGDQTG